MTVENISWSISTKECCRPRRGLNPRPPGLQADGASNWATEAGKVTRYKIQAHLFLVGFQCATLTSAWRLLYRHNKGLEPYMIIKATKITACKRIYHSYSTYKYSRIRTLLSTSAFSFSQEKAQAHMSLKYKPSPAGQLKQGRNTKGMGETKVPLHVNARTRSEKRKPTSQYGGGRRDMHKVGSNPTCCAVHWK